MIQCVEKALNILSFMVNRTENTPAPLSMIAEACMLHAATCSHLVDTLCACSYLEKVSRKDGYILGPMGYCVSARQYYRQDMMEAALPIMRRLCGNLHVDVSISTFVNNKLFVPYSVFYKDEGYRYQKLHTGQLFQSASGRVVIAYMSRKRLDELLTELSYPTEAQWTGAQTREDLERALEKIRREGIASIQRVNGNLSAVAVPILLDNRLQAVVGVYMQDERFEGEFLVECERQTLQAAHVIAKKLKEKLHATNAPVYRCGETIEPV